MTVVDIQHAMPGRTFVIVAGYRFYFNSLILIFLNHT